jgi:hypothetical protein
MKKDFETSFTGWTMITAAIFLIAGWLLLPHHIGEYFVASDYQEIGKNIWFWIWMYRVHIFGWVIMGIAMFAFAVIAFDKPFRILTLPGLGVIIVGTFTTALAFAFYYTYGAWNVGKTSSMSSEELQTYSDNFLVVNHYFTCLVRFGRIFSGLGFIVFGYGLIKSKLLPSWISIYALLMGLAALCVILFIPDNFDVYKPLYYAKVVWLVLAGISIVKSGMPLTSTEN